MRITHVIASVAGGTAVLAGLGWGLADGLGSPATAAPTASVTDAALTTAAPDHQGGHLRGKVTAENGSTWTVTTAKRGTVTVAITPQTTFGTKKKPETAAQFPVGSEIAVAGTSQDTTHLTATRIGTGHRERGVRGKVTAENGSTWTVLTAKGRSVTVTITPTTAFGTKKDPATATQFPVGSEVRVLGGKGADGSLTATRIVAPKVTAGTPSPSSAPSGAPAAPSGT